MLGIQKQLSNSFFVLLAMPASAMGFALSVQIAALSWILGNKYGLDIHDVGLVWAAGPLAGIIGQVLVGLISDNVWFWNGRRRPFILIGGVIASLMLLALPNIGIISSKMGLEGVLGVAIAVALSLDLAINISFNPTRSIIADVTPEGGKRTRGYTWMQTVSGTISVGAYAIGAIWDNYVLIYLGAGVVFLCAFVPPFFIEESRQLAAKKEEPTAMVSFSLSKLLVDIKPLWGFLIYDVYAMTVRLAKIEFANYYAEYICLAITLFFIGEALFKDERGNNLAGFRKILAAHSFSWLGVQSMFVYIIFYVADKFPDLNEIGQGRVVSVSFLILNAVGAIVPATVLEPLAKKIGRVKTHQYSIGSMVIAYVGIIFFGQNSPNVIYIMMAILGIGWGSIVSLPFAVMSQKVDKARMGLYMGLFNLSIVLPQLVASLGIGLIVSQAMDKTIIFVVSALTLAISTLAWTMVREPGDN